MVSCDWFRINIQINIQLDTESIYKDYNLCGVVGNLNLK